MLCHVCSSTTARAYQTVPDRAPDCERCDQMCPLCFDGFLGIFPLTPRLLADRELTGHTPPQLQRLQRRLRRPRRRRP